MRAAVVHLIGHPGAGKRTIARALDRAAPWRTVVLDNHLTSDAVLTALAIGEGDTVDDVVWGYVAEIRDVVDRAIRDLAPPDVTYVATNVVTDISMTDSVQRLSALAEQRGGAYVPVVVRCEVEEIRRRVVDPERRARRKWMDAGAVAAFVASHALVVPDSPHLLQIDVTRLSPQEAAARILHHLEQMGG